MINRDANNEYAQKHFDRACRKYEEALGIFRYYEATSPDWQSKGIDDDHLKEVDYIGKTTEHKKIVENLKLNCYMNIASCNIKTKAFTIAIAACDEVLKLSPKNAMAFYRRARATALPINAGVPDLRKAIKDLELVIKLSK